MLIKIFLLACVAIYLEKPAGSLAGRVSMEKSGFGLSSFATQDKGIGAVAIGPRNGQSDERGVWVKPDGTFRVDHLPVGEYSLRVRAPGFGTEYVNSILVDEGKVTVLSSPIAMSLIQPSINIASNTKVFTTKEKPCFRISATASSSATVKLYKTDIVDAIQSHKLAHSGYEIGADFTIRKNSTAKSQSNPFAKEVPVAQFSRHLENDYTDSSRADFKLDKPLVPGDYVTYAEAEGITGRDKAADLNWFTVTDLGLVIKKAPNITLIRAINLNTLRPAGRRPAAAPGDKWRLLLRHKGQKQARMDLPP